MNTRMGRTSDVYLYNKCNRDIYFRKERRTVGYKRRKRSDQK